ncbi:MAG: RNA ligase family protein, partial [Bacteroidota bacterium]
MDAPEHFPYEKISTNLQKSGLSEAEHRAFRAVDFVVTEKIHGANFCIHRGPQGIHFAKRKALLTPEDDFFGYGHLREQLKATIKRLHAELAEYPAIAVYGELFGGAYPHRDVEADPRFTAVQSGVWYCPDLRFCAFDIAVTTSKGLRHYLPFDRFTERCESVRLLYTPALFRGRLGPALAFSHEFPTTLPKLFGLPPLPDNYAEGVVVKAAESRKLPGHDMPLRPVVKRKTKAFAEDLRYH